MRIFFRVTKPAEFLISAQPARLAISNSAGTFQICRCLIESIVLILYSIRIAFSSDSEIIFILRRFVRLWHINLCGEGGIGRGNSKNSIVLQEAVKYTGRIIPPRCTFPFLYRVSILRLREQLPS